MTVAVSTNVAGPYACNGAQTVFTINFYFLDNTHVQVIKTVAAVDTTLTYGADYTLTGAGVPAGGTFTTVATYAAGTSVRAVRVVPVTQLADYLNNDVFPAQTTEDALDKLTMIAQQLTTQLATVGGVIAGFNLGADYPVTGLWTHTKQSARTLPSWQIKSLQSAVDIADANILLASDYVAMMDLRKTTDTSVEAPVDASWGGNFCLYAQHKPSGTNGVNGTLTGGIRAQVETTQVHGAGAAINDCVAVYAGLYNAGTDVGAFGFHADAYHVGATGANAHSTYAISCEIFKNIAGGVTANFLGRSQGTQVADYGMMLMHAGGGTGFKRGISLGSPTYANGGVQGAPGAATTYRVGVDLTWGSYTFAALQVLQDTYVYLSGQSLAETATPIDTCKFRWASGSGNFEMYNGASERLAVNMTTGRIRQNGVDSIALQDSAVAYTFAYASAGGKDQTTVGAAGGASALPATPTRYMKITRDGASFVIPCYAP
jgi:hypothetical protein